MSNTLALSYVTSVILDLFTKLLELHFVEHQRVMFFTVSLKRPAAAFLQVSFPILICCIVSDDEEEEDDEVDDDDGDGDGDEEGDDEEDDNDVDDDDSNNDND